MLVLKHRSKEFFFSQFFQHSTFSIVEWLVCLLMDRRASVQVPPLTLNFFLSKLWIYLDCHGCEQTRLVWLGPNQTALSSQQVIFDEFLINFVLTSSADIRGTRHLSTCEALVPKCASGLADSGHSWIFSVAQVVPEKQARIHTRQVRVKGPQFQPTPEIWIFFHNILDNFRLLWMQLGWAVVITAKSGF